MLLLLGIPIDRNLTFKTYAKERRRKWMFAMWKMLRLQASGKKKSSTASIYFLHEVNALVWTYGQHKDDAW